MKLHDALMTGKDYRIKGKPNWIPSANQSYGGFTREEVVELEWEIRPDPVKPREWWVAEYREGLGWGLHLTDVQAKGSCCNGFHPQRVFKVREVICGEGET